MNTIPEISKDQPQTRKLQLICEQPQDLGQHVLDHVSLPPDIVEALKANEPVPSDEKLEAALREIRPYLQPRDERVAEPVYKIMQPKPCAQALCQEFPSQDDF